MPRRFADYLPSQHVVSGWAAAAVVAGVLIAINVVMATAYMLVRRRRMAAE